jgi:hypothetical protein
VLLIVAAVLMVTLGATGQDAKRLKNGTQVSFKKDVFPIIKKQCLPCHAEDNFNPSELSLDSYTLLMAGGKHGPPVEAGKSKESILIQKLSDKPPFGDPMPLDTKKKKGEPSKSRLSDEEIKRIAAWIDQGARNN